MRSYTVYGTINGGPEIYIDQVYTAAEAKLLHQKIKSEGVYNKMFVRDCLGGLQFSCDIESSINYQAVEAIIG